jgi:hypothetical protein
MRKLALLLSVLVMLVTTAAATSAGKPEPQAFTLTGYTTVYNFGTRPNGRTWFHLTAEGTTSGYFSGDFTFEEWGEVDLDPLTGQGSGMGKNNGVVIITTPEGTSVVRFNGKTDSASVWGNFRIEQKEGTGAYADLKGNGDYTGNAGLVFSVTFAGKLKD